MRIILSSVPFHYCYCWCYFLFFENRIFEKIECLCTLYVYPMNLIILLDLHIDNRLSKYDKFHRYHECFSRTDQFKKLIHEIVFHITNNRLNLSYSIENFLNLRNDYHHRIFGLSMTNFVLCNIYSVSLSWSVIHIDIRVWFSHSDFEIEKWRKAHFFNIFNNFEKYWRILRKSSLIRFWNDHFSIELIFLGVESRNHHHRIFGQILLFRWRILFYATSDEDARTQNIRTSSIQWKKFKYSQNWYSNQ